MKEGEHLKPFEPESMNDESSIEEIIAEYTEHEEEAPDAQQKPRRIWRWTSQSQSAPDMPPPSVGGDTMDLSKVLGVKKRPGQDQAHEAEPPSSLEQAIEKCEHELRKIASGIGLLMILCLAGGLMTVLSRFGIGPVAPTGITVYSVTLLVLQIACAAICSDVLIEGIRQLLSFRLSMAAMLFIANVLCAVHALLCAVMPRNAMGIPFCAVASCALLFYELGRKVKLNALRSGYKLASGYDEARGVYRRSGDWDGGDIFAKQELVGEDFVAACEKKDPCQKFYIYFCPAMLILCVVSSLIVLLSGAGIFTVIRVLASTVCAACTFSSTLSFALPYRQLNKVLHESGACISAWAGAKAAKKGGGVVISDSDLFPRGRVTLTGMKIIGVSPVDWALSLAASVIDATGSDLAPSFIELMVEQGGSRRKVDMLRRFGSDGYSAIVNGSDVLIGTRDFLLTNGVAISDALIIPGGIYMSVGLSLTAVFLTKHSVSAIADAALENLGARKNITPIIASRDFLIDRVMLDENFSADSSEFILPDLSESERLLSFSGPAGEGCVCTGVCTREGLAGYMNLILGGKKLHSCALLCCVLTTAAAILGLEFIFFLTLSGSYTSASAANLLLYSLLWLLPPVLAGLGAGRL